MSDAKALDYIQQNRLHVHGGPAPNGRMSWVVASENTGPWRGSGATLAAALEDMQGLKRAGEELEALL